MYEKQDAILNNEQTTSDELTVEDVAMGANAGLILAEESVAEGTGTEEKVTEEAVIEESGTQEIEVTEPVLQVQITGQTEQLTSDSYVQPTVLENSTQQSDQTLQGVYSGYVQQSNASQPIDPQQQNNPEQEKTESYAQQVEDTVKGTGGQSWSAKEIHPPKKKGWGGRIVALILCGLLLGGSTAGAYYGVTYLIERFTSAEVEQTSDTDPESTEKKEPEISQIEAVAPVQSGNVTVGVAYDVSPVVENVMPSMVSIINKYTETYSTIFGQSYTQEGASSGSGIIIGENDTELLVATNYHVVEGADALEITFIDGTVGQAHVKGTNPDMDLAVVSISLDSLSMETKKSIAVASLGNSDNLKLGQPVIAIGNALGYGQSVTTGVVSALNREIAIEEGSTGSFIQTDAAINPGNSGGALLNMNGEVIGINSSKIGGSAIEGMGYAIPISAAEPIISDLSLQTTKVKVDAEKRGYLGVSIKEIPSSDVQKYGIPQGVVVSEVVKGSAAEFAVLKMYDIIVGFDSFEIKTFTDLQEAMQYYEAGATVPVEIMRIQNSGYEKITLQITLGVKPE